MLFMQEQCNCQVSYLFFRVFGCADEVDGFQMSKVDIPAQDINVQQFANIFLLVVSAQTATLELLPYVCQLFVYPFLLQFSRSRVSEVCNE